MARNPVRGFRRTFVLLSPSVNWPNVSRLGDDALRLLRSVMCGSPLPLTVASTPIFIAGARASISEPVKVVSRIASLILPAPFSFDIFSPRSSRDRHERGVDA